MARVSVITVVKNHASGLTKTQASLLSQSFADWEMIIVVGSSEDETLQVAKGMVKRDSRVHILEQKSSGIYGAMNEGLELARGEFTWFMNAGDIFANQFVLENAEREISKAGIALVIGGYQIENGGIDRVYSYPNGRLKAFDFAFNRRGGCHQAMIFSTETLKFFRGFDESYSLAADFDLVLKVLLRSSAVRVSEIYASIEPGGKADQGIRTVHKEKHEIRCNLLGGPVILVISLIWTYLARSKIAARAIINKRN